MSQHKNQKISCPQVKSCNSYDIGFCEDEVAGKLNAEFRNLLHNEKVQQSDVIIYLLLSYKSYWIWKRRSSKPLNWKLRHATTHT